MGLMLNWLPNSYDTFYINYKIASELQDVKKIKDCFKKVSGNFQNDYRGFLYFLEILIIETSYQLELLITDPDLFERIRWGNHALSNPDFNKTLSKDQEASFIIRLNSLRRGFSTLREKYDEEEMQKKLTELNSLFTEIDSSLRKKHIIKRKKDSKKRENLVIFEHILRHYNWFKFGSINAEEVFDIDKEVPIHPGDLVSYLLSEKQRRSYFLQDGRIVENDPHYREGYKNTLTTLYSLFFSEKKVFFKRLFDGVSDWIGIQYCYSQIIDELSIEPNINRQLFELKDISKRNDDLKEQIDNIEQLRQLLRNREIRCFKDFYKDWSLVTQYLFGAVRLCNNFKSNLEIIQFDIFDCKKSEKLAYYAIFNPIGGALWDASYWIFFKNPYGYGDPDEMKPIIEELHNFSSQQISIKKVKISEKLLKEYYLQKDEWGREKNQNLEVIKASRGLLGEFFTLFYLIKKYDIRKIVDIDCHCDIKSTDIDVLIETDDSIIVAQVKSFFYFNPEENNRIKNYFKQIMVKYQHKNKKIIKIIVFMDTEIHNSEEHFLICKKMEERSEYNGFFIDLESEREDITNDFINENIDVIYRIEIQEQLKREKKYRNLIESLNKIFPLIDEENRDFN